MLSHLDHIRYRAVAARVSTKFVVSVNKNVIPRGGREKCGVFFRVFVILFFSREKNNGWFLVLFVIEEKKNGGKVKMVGKCSAI